VAKLPECDTLSLRRFKVKSTLNKQYGEKPKAGQVNVTNWQQASSLNHRLKRLATHHAISMALAEYAHQESGTQHQVTPGLRTDTYNRPLHWFSVCESESELL